MIKAIIDYRLNEKKANELTTKAIMALEKEDYALAISICQQALSFSKNIEQRFALLFLESIAASGDKKIVSDCINEAYNY